MPLCTGGWWDARDGGMGSWVKKRRRKNSDSSENFALLRFSGLPWWYQGDITSRVWCLPVSSDWSGTGQQTSHAHFVKSTLMSLDVHSYIVTDVFASMVLLWISNVRQEWMIGWWKWQDMFLYVHLFLILMLMVPSMQRRGSRAIVAKTESYAKLYYYTIEVRAYFELHPVTCLVSSPPPVFFLLPFAPFDASRFSMFNLLVKTFYSSILLSPFFNTRPIYRQWNLSPCLHSCWSVFVLAVLWFLGRSLKLIFPFFFPPKYLTPVSFYFLSLFTSSSYFLLVFSLTVSLFMPLLKKRSYQRHSEPKLFQCTGYGDCNMVFTRSEHLARHARKHTGEVSTWIEHCFVYPALMVLLYV